MNQSAKRPGLSRRAALRWLRRVLLFVLFAGVVGLIVFAALPKPVPVDVVPVARGEMVVTVDEDGRSRVKDRHIVSAPLAGNVARIELDPGDEVKQGSVVARIVPLAAPLLDVRTKGQSQARVAASLAAQRQSRSQIERAQAALEFAKTNAARVQELHRRQVATPQQLEQALLEARTTAAELESARFAARVADYELEMARAALGHLSGKAPAKEDQLEVPAPVTGRILKVIQESEGAVQAGAPLLEIGDPQALEIVVDVLTSDAVRIEPGNRVNVDRWGGPTLDARVRLVEPSAFSRLSALGVEEQRVNVIIDLVAPREQWKELGDGYRVEAHIAVWEAQNVVHVPTSAIFRHDSGWAVYRVEGDIARITSVKLGERNPRVVQIVEGLAPSARVVVHPSERVRDGIRVVAR